MPDAATARKMLAALWERNLPATKDKLAVLERAVAAATSRTLDAGLCQQAAGEAHKLAGSLGMFGYPKGTDLARSIEQHLDACAEVSAVDVAFLRGAVHALRAELGL